MPKNAPTRSILYLAAASALWGAAWIIMPWLQPVATPCAAFALVTGLSGVALTILSRLIGRRNAALQPAGTIPLRTTLLLSMTLIAVPMLLSVIAGQQDIAGWPILLFGLQALGLGVVLGRWSPASAIAPGALFILTQQSLPFDLHRFPWLLVQAVAVVVQGYGIVNATRTLPGMLPGASPGVTLRSAGTACLAAAVVFAAGSLWFDTGPRIAGFAAWRGQPLWGLALLVIGATAIPYALFWKVLAAGDFDPPQVAAGQWAQSFVASATAAFSVHAVLGWQDWLAFLAIPCCLAAEWKTRTEDETSHGVFLGTRLK